MSSPLLKQMSMTRWCMTAHFNFFSPNRIKIWLLHKNTRVFWTSLMKKRCKQRSSASDIILEKKGGGGDFVIPVIYSNFSWKKYYETQYHFDFECHRIRKEHSYLCIQVILFYTFFSKKVKNKIQICSAKRRDCAEVLYQIRDMLFTHP